jgi:hypothetical protein
MMGGRRWREEGREEMMGGKRWREGREELSEVGPG